MTPDRRADEPYLILTRDDYVVLGPESFGAPGLVAIEILGPFAPVKALGPLITVHDSTVDAHLGIGHHPHRHNERIFYIMAGELDHDDRLNGIQGHMGAGDTGLFTEGQRGMLHSEWNHGDVPCHAFILVYTTNPIPEEAAFTVLPAAAASLYEEAPGVATKEIVGPRSSLRVHGDIRLFADSRIEAGGVLPLRFGAAEGGLVSVQEGSAILGGERVPEGGSVLFPPLGTPRSLEIEAVGPARLLRVVHGRGLGLVLR